MSKWEDGLIKTGVDKLMQYLRQEEEVGIEEAADSLGVDKDIVIKWAKSLQDSGLAEINYTASKGRRLKLADGVERSKEKLAEARKDAEGRLEELSELGSEKARMKRFEDALKRIQKELSHDEDTAEDLREHVSTMNDDLDILQAYLDDIEEAEEDVSELREKLKDIENDIEEISELEFDAVEDAESASEAEERGDLEEREEQSENASGVESSLETVEEQSDDERTRSNPVRKITGKLKGLVPSFGRGKSDEDDGTYSCDQCGKQFESVRGLQTHQGMVHKHDYTCDECGRAFDTVRGLRTHEGMVHEHTYAEDATEQTATDTDTDDEYRENLEKAGQEEEDYERTHG